MGAQEESPTDTYHLSFIHEIVIGEIEIRSLLATDVLLGGRYAFLQSSNDCLHTSFVFL